MLAKIHIFFVVSKFFRKFAADNAKITIINPRQNWRGFLFVNNPAVSFSVPYTTEGAQQFLTQVRPFVEACELPDGMAVDMALEELVYEIVETNSDRRPDETFDVRIIDKEAVFTVVLKSKGPLRNPIYKYSDSDVMNIEDHNLRRAILSRVCKNISHKYMNGINCIYLNYHRQGN